MVIEWVVSIKELQGLRIAQVFLGGGDQSTPMLLKPFCFVRVHVLHALIVKKSWCFDVVAVCVLMALGTLPYIRK